MTITLLPSSASGGGGGSGLRNAVLSASSSNFLTTSGLNVGILGGTICSIAEGFDSSGNPKDTIVRIANSNATAWSIPANSTRYLWIDKTGAFGSMSTLWFVADDFVAATQEQIIKAFTSFGSGVTLSEDNTKATFIPADWRTVIADHSSTSAKLYAEFFWEAVPSNANFGIVAATANLETHPGATTPSFAYHENGTKFVNGVNSAFGSDPTAGDVIGLAVDTATGQVWASRNGSWQASGNPAAGTNPAAILSGSSFRFAAGVNGETVVSILQNLNYFPPVGFNEIPSTTHFYVPRMGLTKEYVSGTWEDRSRLFVGEVVSGASSISSLIIYPVLGRKTIRSAIVSANTNTIIPTGMGSNYNTRFSVSYPPGSVGNVVGVDRNSISVRVSTPGQVAINLDRGY